MLFFRLLSPTDCLSGFLRRPWLVVLAGIVVLPLGVFAEGAGEDWPMLGGSPDRNQVSTMTGASTDWDVETGKNVKWVAELGSQTYANPVISGGMVFIGTNNDAPRDPKVTGDRGVLMAFRESDGEFLWQAVSDKLEIGAAQDWPEVGVCSTPLVEGDRLYYINNRDELVCLDTKGFADGENDGPFKEEVLKGEKDADVIWKLDMIKELGVFPHNASNSSPVALGKLLYLGTSNGRSEDHATVPSPEAPSLLAVDKETGKVVWSDNSPGSNIMNGQWTSPTVAKIGGVDQVITGQGDGWIRSFEAVTGKKLWEFDTNPPDSVYPENRNEVLGTVVAWKDHVFIANGQDPENGEGEGSLVCIDATKRGDITSTGKVWEYTEIRRSISTPAIHNGLIYYPDFSGFLHCLDVKTGEKKWVHDTFAAVWSSPIVIGDLVYLGDEDGDMAILKAGPKEEVVAEIYMGSSVYSSVVPANGVIFLATRNKLYAIGP